MCDYTQFRSKVYSDVQKDENLCSTEKTILTIALWFAHKGMVCYFKAQTFSEILDVSVERVKNILLKLENLKYIRRRRFYRGRFIYVHSESEYFKTHNLSTKTKQLEQLKESVDKPVRKGCGQVTLQHNTPYNNIYKNNNTQRASHDYNNWVSFNQNKGEETEVISKIGEKANVRLLLSLAKRRKITLSQQQTDEILYHIKIGLSKNNPFMTIYRLIQQALTLILSGAWSTPHGIQRKLEAIERRKEDERLEAWGKQKKAEIEQYRRSDTAIKSLGDIMAKLRISCPGV